MTALGFDVTFLILIAAGSTGAFLRVVCSPRQDTFCRSTLGDAMVGGVSAYIALPVLSVVPFVSGIVAKLDTTASKSVLIFFVGYVASHVWTTVARQRVPAWLAALADKYAPKGQDVK